MKRLTIILTIMFCGMACAQNFSTQSQFSDNWSLSLQEGLVEPFEASAVSPTFTLNVDKYLCPWLGVGLDARTVIATGDYCNLHTAFDDINLSIAGKVNISNLFIHKDGRRFFEPVPYLQAGWGHRTCTTHRDKDYMTVRAGCEFCFNLGQERAWGIVVNPSAVWGGVRDLRLSTHRGHFEMNIGAVYHFRTSNGTHGWYRFKEEPPLIYETVKEVPVEKVVTKKVVTVLKSTYLVNFEVNSSIIANTSELDKIPEGVTVDIVAYASPEGSQQRNTELSQARAYQVSRYLAGRGVKVKSAVGKGAEDNTSNRIAIVTIIQ